MCVCVCVCVWREKEREREFNSLNSTYNSKDVNKVLEVFGTLILILSKAFDYIARFYTEGDPEISPLIYFP